MTAVGFGIVAALEKGVGFCYILERLGWEARFCFAYEERQWVEGR